MNILNKEKPILSLRKTLQQTELIPPLPETARSILILRNNPDARLEELVSLIETDPALSAFIMKYARMSTFGYGDRIISVTHAISLALGYPTALNITLAIASSDCLKIPNYGPLGRIRIWNDALECAQLCRELSKYVAKEQCMNSDLAYLGGLLHNFGYLLFAHFCPEEFASLNEMISHDPEQDIRALEARNFGITHDLLGLYLLKAWNMPEEIILMAGKHHFPDCAGKHSVYVKLIVTANYLLEKDGMHHNGKQIEISALLTDLGISEPEAQMELQKIHTCQGELNQLAQGLIA